MPTGPDFHRPAGTCWMFGQGMKNPLNTNRGFSLIELVIAVAILTVGIIAVVQAYQLGVMQLSVLKTRQQVSECGRLVMEYLESIPGDTVFNMAPGNQSAKFSFADTNASMDINNYVKSSMPVCVKLSGGTQLRYQLCNGCSSYLSAEAKLADPTGLSTTCIYDIAVRVIWQDQRLGSGMKRVINFRTKQYSNFNRQNCAAICGMGTDPETSRKCVFGTP